MTTDPIANLINTLKTSSKAGKDIVVVPHSKLKEAILAVLAEEGYVKSFSKKGKKVQKTIEVELAYTGTTPRITDAVRVSRPSKRMYYGVSDIHPVRQGYGRLIMSTPKGILSDAKARKEGVGGEPLFKIW